MISIYINQEQRPDVLIQTGGSLEQTSEHASSSDITIRVPADADPIKECDYIQIYDGDTIIYAGTVLKCEQEGFPITPPWRLYTLSLASNSDLVASIYVDLGFPQDANINQILFGNLSGSENYDPSLPQFVGIFNARIQTEGISLGTVDDFSDYTLSEGAYLWGRTVLDVLDELAEIAGAWWEITPGKVFNMCFSNNRPKCNFQLTPETQVFDLSVSQDALTFYSACRVIGGQGEIPAKGTGTISVVASLPSSALPNSQYIVWKDEKTLVSNLPLARIGVIRQSPYSSGFPGAVNVGYSGINDDDPNYQALMTYGGTEITMKDEVGSFLNPATSGNSVICIETYFLTDVFARIVDGDLTKEISDSRGGSGIVEYVLEDDTIKTFSAASLAALGFLASYAKKAVSISFSSFIPCEIGAELSCDLPYYSVTGAYQITQITTEFVLDSDDSVIAKYTVTASNIPYRDPYKALWFTAKKVSFALEAGQAPENGYYTNSVINLQSYVSAYQSTISTWRTIQNRAPSWTIWENSFSSWQNLQANTAPYSWSNIESLYISWQSWNNYVVSWAFLENYGEVFFSTVDPLTQQGKQAVVQFLSGNQSTPFNVYGNMLLNWTTTTGQQNQSEVSFQDFSSLGNGGIVTFYLSPESYNGILDSFQVNIPGTSTPAFVIPLGINRVSGQPSGGTPQTPYALTISIRTTVQ